MWMCLMRLFLQLFYNYIGNSECITLPSFPWFTQWMFSREKLLCFYQILSIYTKNATDKAIECFAQKFSSFVLYYSFEVPILILV